jgi:6-phosphogluconolactonase (cycloisomerase 2 family)
VLNILVLKYAIWENDTNFSLTAFIAHSKNNLQTLLNQSTLSCPKHHIKISISKTKALIVKSHYDGN